jgi:hypothetical protein
MKEKALMKKILFLMLLMILLISCHVFASDKQTITTPEVVYSDQILQATLLIDVIAIQSDIASIEHSVGTLVQHRGEMYVLTHNHFSDLLEDTSTVALRDANNRTIKLVFASEFKRWIVYQNPGTMVLRAPDFLADILTPAKIDTQPQLGDIVRLAHRVGPNRDSIEILSAVIEEIDTFESTPVYILRSQEGQYLAPGDSGGGVWFNDVLIANNWAIIPKSSIKTTSGNHNIAVDVQTDLSIAAILPELMFSLNGTRY